MLEKCVFFFGGKVMEVNDTPLIERGISKNNCLTVILLKKNEKNDDEMKEAVEESNEDVVELDDTDNERDSNVDVDSEESTSDQSNKNSKFNNEDDDDDEDSNDCSSNIEHLQMNLMMSLATTIMSVT